MYLPPYVTPHFHFQELLPFRQVLTYPPSPQLTNGVPHGSSTPQAKPGYPPHFSHITLRSGMQTVLGIRLLRLFLLEEGLPGKERNLVGGAEVPLSPSSQRCDLPEHMIPFRQETVLSAVPVSHFWGCNEHSPWLDTAETRKQSQMGTQQMKATKRQKKHRVT